MYQIKIVLFINLKYSQFEPHLKAFCFLFLENICLRVWFCQNLIELSIDILHIPLFFHVIYAGIPHWITKIPE